jgi:hypothetical protein
MLKIFFFNIIILLSGTVNAGFAQEMKNNWFLDLGIRGGTFVSNSTDQYFNNTALWGTDLRVGKQTFGKKEWEQWHRFPSYGLLIRYGKFNNPRLNQKIGLLFFMDGNIIKQSWFSLKYELAAGLAFWFNHYHLITNPHNLYIGSTVTCHLNLALSANFMIAKSLDLILRGTFSHSSNGVLKMPNLGVNMASGDIALRYYFKKRAEQIITIDTVKCFSPVNTFLVYYAPGACKSRKLFNPPDQISQKLFFTSTLQIAYYRQPHPVFRYGAGLDLMYNAEIINHLPDDMKKYSNCISLGAFASLEIIYERLIINVELGTYPYRAYDFNMLVYERFGFKFLCDKRKKLFFGVALKAHAARAESIEWLLGYQFVSWKDKKFTRKISYKKR